jgi:hypothetical protein
MLILWKSKYKTQTLKVNLKIKCNAFWKMHIIVLIVKVIKLPLFPSVLSPYMQ